MRFVETVDNKMYEVLDKDGNILYNVKRESASTSDIVYCNKWVARDLSGNMVGEPDRYREDLFQYLQHLG
ncbi:hypothetical protein DRQ53_08580 [bacterium]|nr:MAG: hypothetical protein DRQ53_08580 [bacterium]